MPIHLSKNLWDFELISKDLSGVAAAETVKGIQGQSPILKHQSWNAYTAVEAGVIATTKHFIANEQEHFRQAPEATNYG